MRDPYANTPRACHQHLRAVLCDHRLRIAAEPARADEIAAALDAKVRRLSDPRMASLPPDLWRGDGEDAEAYLARCYDSALIRSIPPEPKETE